MRQFPPTRVGDVCRICRGVSDNSNCFTTDIKFCRSLNFSLKNWRVAEVNVTGQDLESRVVDKRNQSFYSVIKLMVPKTLIKRSCREKMGWSEDGKGDVMESLFKVLNSTPNTMHEEDSLLKKNIVLIVLTYAALGPIYVNFVRH